MPTTAPTSPLTGGRLAAVVAGGLVTLLAATAGLAGAGLHWAASKQDDAGYYTTGTARVTTTTHAIATDDLDVGGVPGDLGKVRLHVRGARPVFAGIARTRDVDAYLRGAAHATLTDVEVDPFEPTYRTTPGTARPFRPGGQRFWAATTDGTQPLDWTVQEGHWSVVVMNADGSPGVDARVSAGATLPFLDELELVAWIAAAVLLALGGGMLAAGLRRGRIGPA